MFVLHGFCLGVLFSLNQSLVIDVCVLSTLFSFVTEAAVEPFTLSVLI